MNKTRRKCPVCGKPAEPGQLPFCSSRCRDRDLVRWLDDGYAIAGDPLPGDTDPEG